MKYDINYYNFNKKDKCVKNEIDYMLIRCLKMFRWKNLPKFIPARSLELFLQTGGFVFFTDKADGEIRIFQGGLGGEPDYLYRPTIATIANPALNYSATLPIIWDKEQDGDVVIMLNDGLLKGLIPLHSKHATMLVENELSLKVADINSRSPFLLAADDNRTFKSASKYLEDIEKGKLGVIQNSAFLQGLKEYQLTNQMHMLFSGLIEYEQYIKSSWWENLGLNEIMNGMKKEYVSETEEKLSEDSLLPLVDEMLEERKRACEIINEKFGTNIEVEFDSSWEDNMQEIELNHEVLESEGIDDGGDESNNGLDNSPEEQSGGSDSESSESFTEEGEPSEDEAASKSDDEQSGSDGRPNIDVTVEVDIGTDKEKNEDEEDNEVEEPKEDDSDDE